MFVLFVNSTFCFSMFVSESSFSLEPRDVAHIHSFGSIQIIPELKQFQKPKNKNLLIRILNIFKGDTDMYVMYDFY